MKAMRRLLFAFPYRRVAVPVSFPRRVAQEAHYHAGGIRINPNLYATGKVCLSLLNTWMGKARATQQPQLSNQMLCSFQTRNHHSVCAPARLRAIRQRRALFLS